MKEDKEKIHQRLMNMKKMYLKAESLIDSLPDVIPAEIRNMLKDKILGDKNLKNLMDGLESNRPPRFFLIGRTGFGKSSLVNAICGAYVADVSDTVSCTAETRTITIKDNDRVLMEILDTRGIAESQSLNDDISAEDAIIKEVSKFSPDVAILVLSCTHRDDVDSDVQFLKTIANSYKQINKVDLPIVVVINKCDEMAPTRYKSASEYPQTKIDKINEQVKYFKEIIINNKLKIDSIVPVSSLIDWMTSDGTEVSVEDIKYLPKEDIEKLEIAFDGRYNIDHLLDILEKAILDCEAQAGLRMAARLTEVVKRTAVRLTKIFAGLSATVAITPIPVSDIYILLILQCILITLISSLSGRDLSIDSAKEFIFSICGVAGLGYTFRLVAQQAAKFVNAAMPAVGSAISSTIAASGTIAIGNSAIAYYIDDKSIEEVKKVFEASKKQECKK